MNFVIKKNRITLWNGNNYIATILIRNKKSDFSIEICGLENTYNFKNSKQLKHFLKNYCMLKICIPEKVYEHIDAWTVMFNLT